MFLGDDNQKSGAAEHGVDRDEKLQRWMAAHSEAHLRDAATKQFDCAVESARQFGCQELKEVFTADEKNGVVSMAVLMTTGRCVFRMWKLSQRQMLGTYSAKSGRPNMKAGP